MALGARLMNTRVIAAMVSGTGALSRRASIAGRGRGVQRVPQLLDDVDRPRLELAEDASEILSDDSEADELHPTEEELPHHDGRPPLNRDADGLPRQEPRRLRRRWHGGNQRRYRCRTAADAGDARGGAQVHAGT